MYFYITKIVITALLIVLISEITKRSTLVGALLAAIPLVSILAMTWMYLDVFRYKQQQCCGRIFKQNYLVDSSVNDIVYNVPNPNKKRSKFLSQYGYLGCVDNNCLLLDDTNSWKIRD